VVPSPALPACACQSQGGAGWPPASEIRRSHGAVGEGYSSSGIERDDNSGVGEPAGAVRAATTPRLADRAEEASSPRSMNKIRNSQKLVF
jgi:hypothetical protein